MNIREASARLYVPGMPNPGQVNRYYVCSEMLRELGWEGAGDYWYETSDSAPVSFGYALGVTGLGHWYDYAAMKELLERSTAVLGEHMRKVFADMLPAVEDAISGFRKIVEAAGSGGK